LSFTLHPHSIVFKTAKHTHFTAIMPYKKNIILNLAAMLPALASSLALGTTQQQNLEPGQWHPALDSDGTQRKRIDVDPFSPRGVLTSAIARGPCPMMNTLANHGFLHRDGLNLTEDVVIKALQDGLNFDTSLSETMFKMALPANPDPNATWFTL
jgi:hypothetical protein